MENKTIKTLNRILTNGSKIKGFDAKKCLINLTSAISYYTPTHEFQQDNMIKVLIKEKLELEETLRFRTERMNGGVKYIVDKYDHIINVQQII